MRNTPPFECPRCGVQSPVGVRCEGCRVEMLDRQGLAALGRRTRFFPSGSFTHALAELGDSIRRWRAMKERRAHDIVPIRDARDGYCRISGRVHVLRAVNDLHGQPVGAFVARRRHVTRTVVEGRYGSRELNLTNFEEVAACGRFAVIDDTGVAIVDDDCFEVFDDTGDALPIGAVAREGERVEVLGPAAWAEAADARELAPAAGYRERPRALVFDGRPGRSVLVFCRI